MTKLKNVNELKTTKIMNVKDVFRKETGEHIEIEKEFNDGVFVDVYNENYIAWLERKVNVTLGSVSKYVLLAKSCYKAKDGTIKEGIPLNGKFYAPKNDC